MSSVTFRLLHVADAPAFAVLLAGYSHALSHAETAPAVDPERARALLDDPAVEILGAFEADRLLAFALFMDIPEAISGRRACQIDDLFVDPAARGRGLAQAVVEEIARLGAERDWMQVRWIVPADNTVARRTYQRFSEQAPWVNHVIWLDPTQRW